MAKSKSMPGAGAKAKEATAQTTMGNGMKPLSNTERQRRYKARRRASTMLVAIEVPIDEIEALIDAGWLSDEQSYDKLAVGTAYARARWAGKTEMKPKRPSPWVHFERVPIVDYGMSPPQKVLTVEQLREIYPDQGVNPKRRKQKKSNAVTQKPIDHG